jgi:NADP-dependent 3-hydroxy acid dehydrogenase YdfG
MDAADLTGTTVIVTGASSGIGAATARLLYQAGAHPVLAARRADRLDALSQELGGALAVVTDVTDRAATGRLAEAALDRHGRIDGLVNNAGVSLHQALDQLDLDEFARVLDLNVISVVAMTQAVLPAMRAQRSGRIVNISSGTTRMALPGVGAYAATKAAVNMLTSVARLELQSDGIAVSLVLPSITATEFAGGRFRAGQQPRPGMTAHSAEYVGRVILRALRTGEERIDIPHGPEQPELTGIPGG